MNYVIFDLEATCDEKGSNFDIQRQEIIEIGAVKINEEGEKIDEFELFVKPIYYPVLSEYCTNLTTITQENVENALPAIEAIPQFVQWFFDENPNAINPILLSWGMFDKNLVIKEAISKSLIKEPLRLMLSRHMNLKQEFSRFLGIKKGMGMAKALYRIGVELVGTHHRGIDDAKNMVNIFKFMKINGYRFPVDNKYKSYVPF